MREPSLTTNYPVGHEEAVSFLRHSLEKGSLSHAYLFIGPPHVGKGTLALYLAQGVNCLSPDPRPCLRCRSCQRIAQGRHADVITLGLEEGKKEMGIDTIREVQRLAGLKPFEGACRVFIFDGVEHLSAAAANSFLKLLEEPPQGVLLILLATDEEALLPTLVSRCQRLYLRPLALSRLRGELEARGLGEVDKLARLSRGCLGWALAMAQEPALLARRTQETERIISILQGPLSHRFHYAEELAALFARSRQAVRDTLYLWLDWWRDLLLLKEGAEDFVLNVDWKQTLQWQGDRLDREELLRALKATLQVLQHLDENVNPRMALEAWTLKLPQLQERGSG